jgi:hypothetical protein
MAAMTSMAATSQSTAAQNGGHHRVLVTYWRRCCQASLSPAGVAEHEQPRRPGDGDRGQQDEQSSDGALDGDYPRSSVGDREPRSRPPRSGPTPGRRPLPGPAIEGRAATQPAVRRPQVPTAPGPASTGSLRGFGCARGSMDVQHERCGQARGAADRRAAVMRILWRRARRFRLLKELGVTVDQCRRPCSTDGGTGARNQWNGKMSVTTARQPAMSDRGWCRVVLPSRGGLCLFWDRRCGGRGLAEPEPLVDAAQRCRGPPVGVAEQGHGGRDQ